MGNLRGKNCLITGAASGIGRALALGLAKEGMNLFLVDINLDGLRLVEQETAVSGVKIFIAQCDVSSYEQMQTLAEDAHTRMGRVDMLINNAGIAAAGLIEELEPEDWEHTLAVNFWSIVYATRVFLPAMIERGEGHIVNTGSGAGVVGVPYHIQYVVSKFAVNGLTEALYSELKHVHPGINVSLICPSYLNTGIIDRTDIKLPRKLVAREEADSFVARADEFKKCFWARCTQQSVNMERAVKKYIQGIKRKKLYIFDSKQLNAALVIKGISDTLYRAVLRREGRGHLALIKGALADMGITNTSRQQQRTR